MPTIVHFEVPADDVERSRKFYSDLFGWKMEKWPGMESGMYYWIINTTDNEGGKAVGGGMMKRQNPQQGITNFIDVTSVDEYSAKVQSLGGKIVAPKQAVPTMGFFAVCMDTEKNVFAVWESAMKKK